MLDVKRQACQGGTHTAFTMARESAAFLVKNYGPATILVCLGEWDESQSVRIDSGYYQRVVSNLTVGGGERPKTDTVIITPLDESGSDEAACVEIQRDD